MAKNSKFTHDISCTVCENRNDPNPPSDPGVCKLCTKAQGLHKEDPMEQIRVACTVLHPPGYICNYDRDFSNIYNENKKEDSSQGINPKDLIGAKKVDLSLLPTGGVILAADCMADGAKKYGPFNWREVGKPVQYMTYLSAAMRHLVAYIDGEDNAKDSGKHHVAHAIAGLMVLLDAQCCNNAIDNRPNLGPAATLFDKLNNHKE